MFLPVLFCFVQHKRAKELSSNTPLRHFCSLFSYVADADGDYIDIKTDKWSSGGYRMDCMDKGSHTAWQCWASCSPFPNPNFMDWGYLTFEVRVSGVFDDVCKPSISITKRWPSYGSNVIVLGECVNLNLLYICAT